MLSIDIHNTYPSYLRMICPDANARPHMLTITTDARGMVVRKRCHTNTSSYGQQMLREVQPGLQGFLHRYGIPPV